MNTKIALRMMALLCVASVTLPAQEEAAKAVVGVQIVDARLGKGVENREIVDETTTFSVGQRVYVWLKVAGASGDRLHIIWKHGDHPFTSTLDIGGSPWRTWVYKTASMPGEWGVSITDSEGNVLRDMTFTVGEVTKEMPKDSAKEPMKEEKKEQ